MAATAPNFPIGEITIPLFVGTIMNWTLFGALVVQAGLYFLAFPRDPRLNRLIVASLVFLETLQAFGDTRNTILTFGVHWGQFPRLDDVGWVWFSVPVLGSTIAFIGQLFFAWRISIISAQAHYFITPILIGILALTQWAAGIWTGVLIAKAGHFSRLSFETMKPPVVWLAATSAADVLIVCATSFYLLQRRQKEFRGPTYTAVQRIIWLTVESGLFSAVFAILDLALFIAFPGRNIHLGVCVWLSKIYSNSILLILNSRATFGHAALPDPSMGSIHVASGMVFHQTQTRNRASMRPPPRTHTLSMRFSTAHSINLDLEAGLSDCDASSHFESGRSSTVRPPSALDKEKEQGILPIDSEELEPRPAV